MIYLFTGTDEAKARAKAFAWIKAAQAKEPNLTYRRLAREELTEAALEDAAQSGGLFISRLLILLDDPFPKARAAGDDADTAEDSVETGSSLVEGYLDRLASSDNAVIILAPKLPAAKAKRFAAKAKAVYTFELPARRDGARGFNAGLTNALAARSREKLWLEVAKALRHGDAPEMLHGLLHWKARDILEKGSRAWTPGEARALSFALIMLLQESRRKNLDLSRSLERFALSV